MIDTSFWKKVSENWIKDDDGIAVPEPTGSDVSGLDPSIFADNPEIDNEIDDILADLGLDDE